MQDDHLERGRAFFAEIPHGQLLDLELLSCADNVAVTRLPYSAELAGNPHTGVVHGGAITSFIDQSSGAAVVCSVAGADMVATLDLRVDHLRPARPGKDLYARAECYRLTPNIAFVRCHVYHEDEDEPVAASMSSFMRGPVSGGPRPEQ